MNEKLSSKTLLNPSTGIFIRNPTHVEIADEAKTQSDIVDAIKESGVKKMTVVYEYSDIDKSNPPPLVGILNIREMEQEEAQKFCKSLLRSRPNIFKIHIQLGEYSNQKRVGSRSLNTLNSNHPRFSTEVAEKLGIVLTDSSLNITELIYTVTNTDPGYFQTTVEAYGVSEKEYKDDQTFNPIIGLEFIKTT